MATARPWQANVEGDGDVFAGDLQIADCNFPQGVLLPEDIRANAALIVRAVNCHDELLAALKELVERRERVVSSRIGTEQTADGSDGRYARARAAIAKAEAHP